GERGEGDGETGERKEIDRMSEADERQRREKHAEEQNQNRPDRRPDVPEEQQGDDDEDEELNRQRLEELAQRRPDPGGSIVRAHHFDAGRQPPANLLSLTL